jgi:omega-6 fatty acid desaturase (delta-12 desaturase)
MEKIVSRKQLRELLKPYEKKNDFIASLFFIGDYSLFFVGQYIVVEALLVFKLLGSLITLIAIIRLFMIGHDTCHNNFFSSRFVNQIIGKFAFFPSMVGFKAWAVGHNALHHAYTNLAVNQEVWQPLSLEEYLSLTQYQKFLYRLYRSSFGAFFYYTKEIWWKYLYFPSTKERKSKPGKNFIIESTEITLWLFAWLLTLYFCSRMTNQEIFPLFFFGFVLPFVLCNAVLGLILYNHHTHPNIRWYKLESEWIASVPYISTTVRTRLPNWIDSVIHYIMVHPAHHLNSNIPCYNLKAAQQKLEELLPEHIVIQDFSWKWYLECTRVCKLYDFEKHEWVGFPEN